MRIALLLCLSLAALGCEPEPTPSEPSSDPAPAPSAAPAAPARAANVGGDGVPFELRASVSSVDSGALDEQVIERVMRRHLNDLRRCFAASRMDDDTLEGDLRLRWIVAPTGAITDSVAEAAPSDDIGRCAAGASSAWRFPSDSMSEEPVTVTTTVRLYAAED